MAEVAVNAVRLTMGCVRDGVRKLRSPLTRCRGCREWRWGRSRVRCPLDDVLMTPMAVFLGASWFSLYDLSVVGPLPTEPT